jgi:DNA/RNA endonuclease YhcR with UshA esterase domain
MRRRGSVIIATLMSLTLTAAAGTVLAHHSFVGQFDPAKLVTMTGQVTEVKWTNPHAYFYIDVEDPDGTMTNWALELGSPNTLIRYRWTRDTLKIGETVTVEGYLARDGSNLANAKTVQFEDGTMVNAASSFDLGTTR